MNWKVGSSESGCWSNGWNGKGSTIMGGKMAGCHSGFIGGVSELNGIDLDIFLTRLRAQGVLLGPALSSLW